MICVLYNITLQLRFHKDMYIIQHYITTEIPQRFVHYTQLRFQKDLYIIQHYITTKIPQRFVHYTTLHYNQYSTKISMLYNLHIRQLSDYGLGWGNHKKLQWKLSKRQKRSMG
jgi:hypothetical protein